MRKKSRPLIKNWGFKFGENPIPDDRVSDEEIELTLARLIHIEKRDRIDCYPLKKRLVDELEQREIRRRITARAEAAALKYAMSQP